MYQQAQQHQPFYPNQVVNFQLDDRKQVFEANTLQRVDSFGCIVYDEPEVKQVELIPAEEPLELWEPEEPEPEVHFDFAPGQEPKVEQPEV